MNEKKACINIAFLSTYPPRECGTATFTEDLIASIEELGTMKAHVIAINDSVRYPYDERVKGEISQDEQADYFELAKKLSHSNFDLLVIEHEFGIYGGDHGDYIFDLINNLEIPFVTTFHTVLSNPSLKQKQVIQEIASKSKKIITMAQSSKEVLKVEYGIESTKIEVIFHGVVKRPHQLRETIKKKFHFEDKKIISTFGLIGPGKGIENGIEAISMVLNDRKVRVVKKEGDIQELLYIILGKTQPALQESGINYRKKLDVLVEQLNLSENVLFVDKYLSRDELIEYLQMSDIYMTPYLSNDQAVSGTLAYAVGYNKVIISTPSLYAQEVLAGGRGLLAEFNDPESLADCINQIFQDPTKQARMEKATEKLGKTMYWDKIALKYADVFQRVISLNRELGATS